MSEDICVVCKQKITDYVIMTDKGPVHSCACYSFIEDNSINESFDQHDLSKVQLL